MRPPRSVLLLLSVPPLLAAAQFARFESLNRNPGVMVSGGERREFLLHVPPGYKAGTPTPLVISLHAAALWPVAQMVTSRWNDLADREGFLVVYPSGYTGSGPIIWRTERGDALRRDSRTELDEPLARDVRFIGDLIDSLSRAYTVDPARIYANGLSNGGGMSFVLSCTLGDRIAAVGLVGAAHLLPSSWCPDPRPVPMIAFHGTADPVVPFAGGHSWVARERFPSIPGFTTDWARRNGCDARPDTSAVAADVTRLAYAHCAADASVELYRIEGGGHTWPGGEPLPAWFTGRTSTGVDATRRMWEFFKAHPRSLTTNSGPAMPTPARR